MLPPCRSPSEDSPSVLTPPITMKTNSQDTVQISGTCDVIFLAMEVKIHTVAFPSPILASFFGIVEETTKVSLYKYAGISRYRQHEYAYAQATSTMISDLRNVYREQTSPIRQLVGPCPALLPRKSLCNWEE